jgi:hypothetical protein
MIRDGKLQGWLSLPVDTLPVWATLNDVSFDGISIGPLPGKEDRGSTVIAKRLLKGGHEAPLMTIPRDLILSLERIHQHAKSDSDFRAVLDGLDEFGRVGKSSAYRSFSSLYNLSSTTQATFHRAHVPFTPDLRHVILRPNHIGYNIKTLQQTSCLHISYHSFSTTADLVSDC